MTGPASGRAGRPAAVARVCRELSRHGAHHRADQHVGRIVHTAVDARVGDGRGEGGQRYGGRRQDVSPTPVANAKAAAECPKGNERELGIRTWRGSGTSPARRSGRRRCTSGLTATLARIARAPSNRQRNDKEARMDLMEITERNGSAAREPPPPLHALADALAMKELEIELKW